MIVTKGMSIRIEAGRFLFHRSCETPGLITVTGSWSNEAQELSLPTNTKEAEQFIAAYRRAISEDIPYRYRNAEPPPPEPADIDLDA